MQYLTHRISNREFLKLMKLVISAFIFISSVQARESSPRSPNVLFIFCDDLNDWVLDPPGHPRPLTPNIDRLRARSVDFSNAHVAVPVCGPSRKCLFSGLYPHTIDSYGFSAWNNTKGLRECVPLPLHFRENGYSAFGTGKLIHEGKGGDFYTDYGIGVDYGPWPMGADGKITWTHSKLHAKYGNLIRSIDFSHGPLSNIPIWNPKVTKSKNNNGWYYKNGQPFRYKSQNDRDKMPDEISAEYAVNILKQKHDRPFYLGVGFVRPHTPLFAPKKYFDLYPLEDITLPPILEGDLDDCSEALRNR